MTERIALGIISVFGKFIPNVSYTFEGEKVEQSKGDGSGFYSGLLTSVAPMECLIDLAQVEGMPITKIAYLCSSLAKGDLHDLPDGTQMTAEEYFRSAIYSYYRDSNNRLSGGPKSTDDKDFFVPIDYREDEPTVSLQEIVDTIGPGKVLVDVETSGGRRDASVLATLAIQVIRTRYSLPSARGADERAGIGNTVYASKTWEEPVGNITLQNRTYDLIDLINAIEAFTGFGKAQPLLDFFRQNNEGRKTSSQLIDLLESMRKFSDDLALCDVADMPSSVADIYKHIRRLQQFHRGNTQNANRAELLFMSLLDGLGEDFVRDVGPNPSDRQQAGQTIALIRWCVSRQLLQQALSLVTELYPKCMEQLGYLDWGTQGLGVAGDRGQESQDVASKRITRVEQLAYYNTRDLYAVDHEALERCVKTYSRELSRIHNAYLKRRACCTLFPTEVANKDYVQIHDHAVRQVPAMLAWYLTIVLLRNEAMHANGGANKHKRDQNYRTYRTVFANADELRCRFDTEGTLDALSADILKAMDALEGAIILESDLYPKPIEPKKSIAASPATRNEKTVTPYQEKIVARILECSKSDVCSSLAGPLGSLVLWEDVFPTRDDEPSLVRNGRQTKESFLRELASNGPESQSLRVTTTLVVNDEELEQSTGGNPGCAAARDYLACEAKRERANTIAFDEARRSNKGEKLLTRNALGIGKRSKQTILEKLCAVYPELFKIGNPAIRVKG